jgi:hypothetical protein
MDMVIVHTTVIMDLAMEVVSAMVDTVVIVLMGMVMAVDIPEVAHIIALHLLIIHTTIRVPVMVQRIILITDRETEAQVQQEHLHAEVRQSLIIIAPALTVIHNLQEAGIIVHLQMFMMYPVLLQEMVQVDRMRKVLTHDPQLQPKKATPIIIRPDLPNLKGLIANRIEQGPLVQGLQFLTTQEAEATLQVVITEVTEVPGVVPAQPGHVPVAEAVQPEVVVVVEVPVVEAPGLLPDQADQEGIDNFEVDVCFKIIEKWVD